MVVIALIALFLVRRRRRYRHPYAAVGYDTGEKASQSRGRLSFGVPFLPRVAESSDIMSELKRNDTIRTFLVGKDDLEADNHTPNTRGVGHHEDDTPYSPESIYSPNQLLCDPSAASFDYEPVPSGNGHRRTKPSTKRNQRRQMERISESDERLDLEDPFDDKHHIRNSPTRQTVVEDPFGDGADTLQAMLETPGGTLIHEIGREYSGTHTDRLVSGKYFW